MGTDIHPIVEVSRNGGRSWNWFKGPFRCNWCGGGWCSLAELLAYNWTGGNTKCGVITLKQYREWRKVAPARRETAAEAAGEFHDKFIPELVALAAREGVSPDHVRYVFGFDS